MTQTDPQTSTPVTPAGPATTGSRATRVIGVLTLASVAITFACSFFFTKADASLGESVRIMYVHVGSVTLAYLCMFLNALCCAWFLWKHNRFADLLAHASAEIGVVLLGLTLITGSLWGRATWSVYWTWDARLTSTALLFLMYVGYLAVRAVPAEPRVRGTRSAIVGLISVILIPVVYKSVDWWRSLHQSATLSLDPKIHGMQLFTLMFSMFAFTLLTLWLLMHRFRLAWLIEEADDAGLSVAIEERRAEGGGGGTAVVAAPPAATPAAPVTDRDPEGAPA